MGRPPSERVVAERHHKAAVRARDNYRCVDCGVSQKDNIKLRSRILEVHRIIPGIEYSRENWCQTLCERCHHNKPRNCKQVIFTDMGNPFKKGLVGIAATSSGKYSAEIYREFERFLKMLEKKYNGDDVIYFGDFKRIRAITRRTLKKKHRQYKQDAG